jgi:hypothetical protein
MPLTDELGNLIRDRLAEVADRTPNGFKGGYFEAWLSRLAEPQPDLADHANFANQGLFLRVTQELHSIMLDKELDVLKGEPPWWLRRFVGLLHTSQSEVITFNYDTLVERTVESLVLSDWKNSGRAQTIHVVRDTPPLPRYGMFGTSQVETLRLLNCMARSIRTGYPATPPAPRSIGGISMAVGIAATGGRVAAAPDASRTKPFHCAAGRSQISLLQQPRIEGVVADRGGGSGSRRPGSPDRLLPSTDRLGDVRHVGRCVGWAHSSDRCREPIA